MSDTAGRGSGRVSIDGGLHELPEPGSRRREVLRRVRDADQQALHELQREYQPDGQVLRRVRDAVSATICIAQSVICGGTGAAYCRSGTVSANYSPELPSLLTPIREACPDG